jgi:hypothetical protein
MLIPTIDLVTLSDIWTTTIQVRLVYHSMATEFFCFYLQNRLIQTSQTGGQWYSDTFPFSIPWYRQGFPGTGPRWHHDTHPNDSHSIFYNLIVMLSVIMLCVIHMLSVIMLCVIHMLSVVPILSVVPMLSVIILSVAPMLCVAYTECYNAECCTYALCCLY